MLLKIHKNHIEITKQNTIFLALSATDFHTLANGHLTHLSHAATAVEKPEI